MSENVEALGESEPEPIADPAPSTESAKHPEPEPIADATPSKEAANNQEPEPIADAAPSKEAAMSLDPASEAASSLAPATAPDSEPNREPEPEIAPGAGSFPDDSRPRFRVYCLLNDESREADSRISEHDAESIRSTIVAAWNPLILARLAEPPRIENVAYPPYPERDAIFLVPQSQKRALPIDFPTQAEQAGATLIEATADAADASKAILDALSLKDRSILRSTDSAVEADFVDLARDFQALAAARSWLSDATAAMGRIERLDVETFGREVLAAARAWVEGDRAAVESGLRASFEMLTQSREHLYPVDSYIVDICLLDPATSAGALESVLEARSPFSLIAPARAIEVLAERDPASSARLNEAIDEGWGDVAGGAYEEIDEPFAPFESILWQFHRGGEVYRNHLNGRTVETLARRRFALYPLLPQIARRFHFRFGIHWGLDDGRFPTPRDPKRLWESPDATSLESLTRVPLAADRAATGAAFASTLGKSMKDDHIATIVLVHWPDRVANWYNDLIRIGKYSSVLARLVTLTDYFHLTDRPYESIRPRLDDYRAPYLAQACSAGAIDPIGRRVRKAKLRARLDALEFVSAVASALSAPRAELEESDPDPQTIEDRLESGDLEFAEKALDRQESPRARALARAIVGFSESGRPGYLVINPSCVARRAPVLLPDAEIDLRPEPPLRAAQFTEEGVRGIVDLPAFGFSWVPRGNESNEIAEFKNPLVVHKHTLSNEFMEVEIDSATGGLRSVKAPGEPSARGAQRLVIKGIEAGEERTGAIAMRADSIEIDYAGPALAQATSKGTIVDTSNGGTLARFEQRVRLWAGRPILDLNIRIQELDHDLIRRFAEGDPWKIALCSRWAWPDSAATLRRSGHLCLETTKAERPETPDIIEISTRRRSLAICNGGLAHHERHGDRMLDTLLIAGRETSRSFDFAIALDAEHAFHAALDVYTPVYVIPTSAGRPRSGSSGWFFQVEAKGIAVLRVGSSDPSGDGRGWGVFLDLIETSGRPTRSRIRFYRDPIWARQVDYRNETIVDLTRDGDAILVDLTPHEAARIDVTLG
jgi:alpha-mannosidase